MRNMMRLVLLILLMALAACQGAAEEAAEPTTVAPALTETPADTSTPSPTDVPPPAPTETATAEPTATATTRPLEPSQPETERDEEAIYIEEPGPGSRVTSPLRVSGMADPTFEQTLVARLILVNGSELALAPTIIEADLGERGPFEVELPFETQGTQQAFLQVYATSARDGGITHLSSVGLTITDAGPENIVTNPPHPERIAIDAPAVGDEISGGTVEVSGFALASFEQTLVIEVLDAQGNVVGSTPTMVNAPDLGQPGPFEATVTYTIEEAGPGRIVVRDPSPAFGGDVHLASVNVTLSP